MITPAPLIAAAEKRLSHRIYCDSDGSARILRNDDQAVWLTREQHRDLITEYAHATRPLNRRLRWGFTLTIPAVLLTLSITFVTGLDAFIDSLPVPGISALAILIVFAWWPTLVLFWHWRAMRAVDAALDALLHELPPAPAPPPRPVAFQTLEIIALFLVGPGIPIDVIGSIFPNAFDGTPLMGRSVGIMTLLGIGIFAIIVGRRYSVWRMAGRWISTAQQRPVEPDLPDTQSTPDRLTRVHDVLRRARSPDDNAPNAS